MKYREVTMKRSGAKKIATGALLCALCVTLLFVGAVFEVLDMTVAALAALVILVADVEFGAKTAFSVYLSSSLLALILMPTLTSNIYFALVLGYFPIFKRFCDRKLGKRLLSLFPKLVLFNIGCGVIVFVFIKLFGFDVLAAEFSGIPPKTLLGFIFAVLNVFFFLMDILVDNITLIYTKVLRKRIFPDAKKLPK